MKLRDWLHHNRVRKGVFAKRIGVSGSVVTGWTTELFGPSRENAAKIARETKGEVMPNDFMPVLPDDDATEAAE